MRIKNGKSVMLKEILIIIFLVILFNKSFLANIEEDIIRIVFFYVGIFEIINNRFLQGIIDSVLGVILYFINVESIIQILVFCGVYLAFKAMYLLFKYSNEVKNGMGDEGDMINGSICTLLSIVIVYGYNSIPEIIYGMIISYLVLSVCYQLRFNNKKNNENFIFNINKIL